MSSFLNLITGGAGVYSVDVRPVERVEMMPPAC